MSEQNSSEQQQGVVREDVVEVLRTVMDPELFIDIWTLGLVYDISIESEQVEVLMTFTSVACPVGPQLADEVKRKVESLPGVSSADVKVTFDPPWEPSDELKAMMGLI